MFLGKLYGPLFHDLSIRILKIENTPIASIEEDTFYGVNRTLQDFYLTNSQINKFPKDAFKVSGNF